MFILKFIYLFISFHIMIILKVALDLQRQEIRMLGDWEESKRLITKHLFNDC